MKTSWIMLLIALALMLLAIHSSPAKAQACGVSPPTVTVGLPGGPVEVQSSISLPGGDCSLNVRGEGFTFNLSYLLTEARVTPRVRINLSDRWSAFAREPGAISLSASSWLEEPADYSALVNTRPEYAQLWLTMRDVCGELAADDEFWVSIDETQRSSLRGILADINEGHYLPEVYSEILSVQEVVAPNHYHGMRVLFGFTIRGGLEPRELSVWDGGDGVIYIDTDGAIPEDRYHLTLHDAGGSISIFWDTGNPASPLTSEELCDIISEIRYTLWDVGAKQIISPRDNPQLHNLFKRAAGSFGLVYPELDIVYPDYLDYQTNIL